MDDREAGLFPDAQAPFSACAAENSVWQKRA
jgi:hypothetical protein